MQGQGASSPQGYHHTSAPDRAAGIDAKFFFRRRRRRNSAWIMRRRWRARREATFIDSNSPKVHRREGRFTTFQIKSVIFTVFHFTSLIRTNTNPNGTGANAASSSVRACVARGSKCEESLGVLGTRCALWVGGACASAGAEGTFMEWRDLRSRLAFFACRVEILLLKAYPVSARRSPRRGFLSQAQVA